MRIGGPSERRTTFPSPEHLHPFLSGAPVLWLNSLGIRGASSVPGVLHFRFCLYYFGLRYAATDATMYTLTWSAYTSANFMLVHTTRKETSQGEIHWQSDRELPSLPCILRCNVCIIHNSPVILPGIYLEPYFYILIINEKVLVLCEKWHLLR